MDPRSAGTPEGKVVAASLVGRPVRDRSLRLSAGLAVAVAIPVAVLFYFQFRSIADLGRSSAVVLRQLSQETADGLSKNIEDALKLPYINTMLGVPQGQTEPFNFAAISKTLDEGFIAEPYVDRYYVWSDNTAEHRDEILAYDRNARQFHGDVPEGTMLVKRFRELAPQKRAISVFEAQIDGRRTYFQAQLRWAAAPRETLTNLVPFPG